MCTPSFKKTGENSRNNINLNINSNKQNHYFGLGINASPIESYDCIATDRKQVLISPKHTEAGSIFLLITIINLHWTSTHHIPYWIGRNSFGFELSPRYRFNDKFSLIYNFNFFRQNNNKGYIDSIDDDLISATPNTIVLPIEMWLPTQLFLENIPSTAEWLST
jgi:hypothetical protein